MKKKYVVSFVAAVTALLASSAAYAQEVNLKLVQIQENKYIVLGIALLLGSAAVGGAISQSRAASAALEGIGRNPGSSDKMFTTFLLALVLIESLVIYALLLSFLLFFKIAS